MSETQSQSVKPVFYEQPMMLSRETHKDLKLSDSTSFTFAQNVASVPVVISEFAVASAHYPIVFVQGDESRGTAADRPMPMALLSTQSGRNDFVDEDGSWKAGTYIPAYVRRYPFVFASAEDKDNFVLCADLSSDRLSREEGAPLFTDGGEPTETTSRALSFCNDFQRDYAMTERFVDTLMGLDLLSVQRLTITRRNQPNTVLEGLSLLNRDKFRKLTDEEFLELRRNGCLGPVYAHLSSLHRLRQFI